jgi:tetratricopeptide (TPR) repeat protein
MANEASAASADRAAHDQAASAALVDRSIERKERGDLEGALADLDAALASGGDDARAHYQRALTLTAADRKSDAIADYESAIAARPDYARALVNLASLYLERQQATSAAPLLARAEKLVDVDNDAVFLVNRAMLARITGDVERAVRDAQRAAIVAPQIAAVWIELGLCCLLDERRTRDAIDANRRALALTPDDAQAAHNLAAALDKNGDAASALEHATRAHSLRPDDATFLQTKACVLLHLHRAHDALPLLERVIGLRPDHFEASYNLACALAKLGDLDRALHYVENAILLVPAQYRAAFIAHVPHDDDLVALRNDERFSAIVKNASSRE